MKVDAPKIGRNEIYSSRPGNVCTTLSKKETGALIRKHTLILNQKRDNSKKNFLCNKKQMTAQEEYKSGHMRCSVANIY